MSIDTNDLAALCREARDTSGDDSLAITVLLAGRDDDDDDFGGVVVGSNEHSVRIESGIERRTATIHLGEIDRAWLCDLNGEVVREYGRPQQ